MMENESGGEVFSKAIRAGKRTYFFDVKTTKGNDLYLTVTERKKYNLTEKNRIKNIKSSCTKKTLKNLKTDCSRHWIKLMN